ncbi:unnamed protein product, partial [Ectocarpus sp. 12 AP-2014]
SSPLAARGLAETSGALGGLVAGGAACSAWSAVCFLRERRHHLRLGLPSGAAMPAYLRGEAYGSAKEGLLCGAVIGAGYLVLRTVSELLPGSMVGHALSVLLGLPSTASTSEGTDGGGGQPVVREGVGRLLVAYLIVVSTAANFALHGFLTKVMNFIIVASQDFLRLWQATVDAASDEQDRAGGRPAAAANVPVSPAAMLLDSLSIGHETVLRTAERDFLQARGRGGGNGGAGGHGASSYTRAGPMSDWTEETELQRRAVALACMEPPRTERRRGGGVGVGGIIRMPFSYTRGVVVPVWAQVAKAQALQSLALKAPCDKNLRVALYEVNIAQVLRTLCLEVDEAILLLQASAVGEDKAEAARALGCEGRGDIKWLVESMASSRGEAGRRWLGWLNDGLSLPFSGTLTLAGLIAVLRSLMTSDASGSGRGRGGEEEGQVGEVLSPARLQSTIWAVQGMSALVVHAPGESRMWSLDTMLPVVLGSLSGLLLAVQERSRGQGGGGGDEDGDREAVATEGVQQPQQQQQQELLVSALEEALTRVSCKYRSCLPDFRFPPVYAETINRFCAS